MNAADGLLEDDALSQADMEDLSRLSSGLDPRALPNPVDAILHILLVRIAYWSYQDAESDDTLGLSSPGRRVACER